jgi:hypothetical protein
MITYAVIVRIGPHEFVTHYNDEASALKAFDDLAAVKDAEVTEGFLSVKADAFVDTVEIRRYNDEAPRGKIGDPTRQ